MLAGIWRKRDAIGSRELDHRQQVPLIMELDEQFDRGDVVVLAAFAVATVAGRLAYLIEEPGNGRNRFAKIPIIAGRSLRSPSCGADNPQGSRIYGQLGVLQAARLATEYLLGGGPELREVRWVHPFLSVRRCPKLILDGAWWTGSRSC
jgi:hypothetical protein